MTGDVVWYTFCYPWQRTTISEDTSIFTEEPDHVTLPSRRAFEERLLHVQRALWIPISLRYCWSMLESLCVDGYPYLMWRMNDTILNTITARKSWRGASRKKDHAYPVLHIFGADGYGFKLSFWAYGMGCLSKNTALLSMCAQNTPGASYRHVTSWRILKNDFS